MLSEVYRRMSSEWRGHARRSDHAHLVPTVVERPSPARLAALREPPPPASGAHPLQIGRYKLCEEIAVGGMGAVHFGRILGDGNFDRPVAIKRLLPHLARDPAFVSMFLAEARFAAKISHPNVVAMLDVVTSQEGEILLVMEYVAGASLSDLLHAARDRGEVVPPEHIVAIVLDALAGLHSAHQAVDDHGRLLGLVHRDVSPQNILVGIDGRARVLDFGIAKATEQPSHMRTSTGVIKGKLGYMAPEQFHGRLTRQSDLYSAAVVLWEALAGRRLFQAETEGALIHLILSGQIARASAHREELSPALDAVVLRGLSVDPGARFETADQMALALRSASAASSAEQIGDWVRRLGGASVRQHMGRPSRGAQTSLLSMVPGASLAPAREEVAPPPQGARLPIPISRDLALKVLVVAAAAVFVATVAGAHNGRVTSGQGAVPATPLQTAARAMAPGVPSSPADLGPSAPPVETAVIADPAPRAEVGSGRRAASTPRASRLRPPDAKILSALDSRE